MSWFCLVFKDSIARKRKAPGAPLVDSALLRFVSKEKKEQEKRIRGLEDRLALPVIPDKAKSLSANKLDDERSSNTFVDGNRNDDDTVVEIASTFGDRPFIDDPWMGQYNRHRIAQKLISLGASEEQALEAGDTLQTHVLIRTARRRIRLFLRERDTLWNSNGMSDPSQQSIQNTADGAVAGDSDSNGASRTSYGFDDIIDVFIEKGFTGTDICAILIHTPSLALMMPRRSFAGITDETMVNSDNGGVDELSGLESSSESTSGDGETLEQTIDRSFQGLLLDTLKMRKYDARKVVRSCPGLLSVRGSKSATQIVAMMAQLGVSTNSIARDKTSLPTLLSRPPADVFRLISFLSCNGVRMPIKSIGPLVRRPACRELLDTIAPVPFSQHRISDSIRVSKDGTVNPELGSSIWGNTRAERATQINEVYRNMTETIWTLRNEIGTKDLGKVIAAYPSVLLLDAEMKILPTATYLMDNLGILEGDLASVLQLYPVLLGKDIEEFEKVASYLLSLGVRKDDLGRIFRAFPALLTMDVEDKMVPVVDYLTSIGVDDIEMFITRLPPILGYSVEDELKPKWEYLNKVCLQANFELKKFPAYFSYPFDKVIKTRYDYLAAKEIPRQLLPVDTILRYGDVEFATKIARDVDGGKVFRAFSANRKRSRMQLRNREQKRVGGRKRNPIPRRKSNPP